MPGNMFNNKSILITGGTGSFGKAFLNYVLKNFSPKKIVVFSRDEYKQYLLQKVYSEKKYPSIRFFIGDVRDYNRLNLAFKNIDFIVHAAALKHVSAAEYNPYEYVKTNIMGAENIARAAMENSVQKVIALSTDKASNPVNLYGATKLVSDKIFIASNQFYSSTKVKFSVVRYGNVAGSRGSVIPFFLSLIKDKKNYLPITDKRMTRFFITLEESIKFVIDSFKIMQGGEIFIPKISSLKIIDLANILAPNFKQKIIGIRPGEKIHETLITKEEDNVYEYNNGYIISPYFRDNKKNVKNAIKRENFELSSNNEKFFMDKNKITKLIQHTRLELED